MPPGRVAAIRACLPGASLKRRRTHYLRDLLTKVGQAVAAPRAPSAPPRWNSPRQLWHSLRLGSRDGPLRHCRGHDHNRLHGRALLSVLVVASLSLGMASGSVVVQALAAPAGAQAGSPNCNFTVPLRPGSV